MSYYHYNGVTVHQGKAFIKGRYWDGIDRPDYNEICLGDSADVDAIITGLKDAADKLKAEELSAKSIRKAKLEQQIQIMQNELAQLEKEREII